MSKIALTPNASGTGTLTIAAPNTNTDRTLTLPDNTGTVVLNEGSGIFKIDSSGFVGIGTTSPASLFDIRGSSNGQNVLQLSNSAGTNDGGAENQIRVTCNGNTNWGNLDVQAYTTIFTTNGTERARIDASGNLLVGTTSQINGHTFKSSEGVSTYRPTVNAGFGIHHFYSDFGSTQSLRAYFTANGGLSNFSANNVNLSDERVKTDIFPVGSYWDKVKALQVVTYKYRDQGGGEDNIGVIAQQVESVAPEFVCTSGFGETPADGVPLKSIYETDMHYATLKALQEAMARIEELTARVAELEAK